MVEDWNFELVQDRLVEAWEFQRSMPPVLPRGGVATDGPWHLVIRERADMVEQALAGHELVRVGRRALRAAEVDRMNEALGWVEHVRPSDARLIALAIASLERSGHQIDWEDVAPRCGLITATGRKLGPSAAKTRYRRAIDDIVRALNGLGPRVPVSR